MIHSTTQIDAAFLNQRRQVIRQHSDQIGIDYVDVKPRGPGQWDLWLYFMPAAASDRAIRVTPENLTPDNIRITDTAGLTDPGLGVVEPIEFRPQDDQNQTIDHAVRIQVHEAERTAQAAGASPGYTLQLADVPDLDPFFAQVSFSLQVDAPSPVDRQLALPAQPEPSPIPEINYLARDYSTFHKLLLDRLSVVMPDWQERNPADLGMALVEVMAYAADFLSLDGNPPAMPGDSQSLTVPGVLAITSLY